MPRPLFGDPDYHKSFTIRQHRVRNTHYRPLYRDEKRPIHSTHVAKITVHCSYSHTLSLRSKQQEEKGKVLKK